MMAATDPYLRSRVLMKKITLHVRFPEAWKEGFFLPPGCYPVSEPVVVSNTDGVAGVEIWVIEHK